MMITIPTKLDYADLGKSPDLTAAKVKELAYNLGIEVETAAYITSCKIRFNKPEDLHLMVLSGYLVRLQDSFNRPTYSFEG